MSGQPLFGFDGFPAICSWRGRIAFCSPMVIRLSRLGNAAAARRIRDARHSNEIDPGLRHLGYAFGFEMFNI